MTESDARAVLLMRSVEQAGLLAAEDAAWAGREAHQVLGETAAPPQWLAQRARLGLQRLAEREPGAGGLLAAVHAGAGPAPWWLLLVLAAGFGLLGDGLGPSSRINLLALPLLGLLAWNAAVYAWLLLQALRGATRPAAAPSVTAPASAAAPAAGLAGLLAAAAGRLQAAVSRHRLRGQPPGAPLQAALARHAAEWLPLARPLLLARASALLHVGAALLALGLVAALYARGLVFDYQAGWDSTFLQPAQVSALLGLVLGPASALVGLPLPGADVLAGLRLASGGGENAAPWIHRWAVTLLGAVVLPRLLLAALAWRRARRLAADVQLPDDPALQRLLHEARPGPAGVRAVAVLPYSYRLDAARQLLVAPALRAWLGPGLQCDVHPSLPLGAEDQLPQWLPGVLARLPAAPAASVARDTGHDNGRAPPVAAPLLVLLFALTATPERESHGAVVQALLQALGRLPAQRPQLRVAVDESAYRQRLAGPDGEQRLAQRRAAWEALLLGLGVVPGFIDLAPVPPTP